MDSPDLSIKLLNFERRYEKLSDFILMVAFDLAPPSEKELNKLAERLSEL